VTRPNPRSEGTALDAAPNSTRGTSRSAASLPFDVLLGWLVPGAGHFARGFARQGRIILGVVVFLFALGLTLSDLEAVSRDLHPYAFWAQLGVAGGTLPLLVIDPARDQILGVHESVNTPVPRWSVEDSRWADEIPPPRSDTGVLFCCVAGLLNLLALFDLVDRSLTARRAVGGSGGAGRPTARSGG
jgi:hypothetical protein